MHIHLTVVLLIFALHIYTCIYLHIFLWEGLFTHTMPTAPVEVLVLCFWPATGTRSPWNYYKCLLWRTVSFIVQLKGDWTDGTFIYMYMENNSTRNTEKRHDRSHAKPRVATSRPLFHGSGLYSAASAIAKHLHTGNKIFIYLYIYIHIYKQLSTNGFSPRHFLHFCFFKRHH